MSSCSIFRLLISFFLLKHTAYRCDRPVGRAVGLDPSDRVRLGAAGIYDLASADVDRHMSGIAHNISRLDILITYFLSASGKRRGTVRKTDSEMRVNAHDISGTIRAIRKACPSADIRISHELKRIGRHIASTDSGFITRIFPAAGRCTSTVRTGGTVLRLSGLGITAAVRLGCRVRSILTLSLIHI